MRRTTLMLGAAITVLAGCTTKAPQTETKGADAAAMTPDASADDAALRAVEKQWFDLYNKGDAAGVANLYADDGMILAPSQPAAVGRAAIEAFLVKDIASSKAANLTDDFGDINGVGVSGDIAWVSGVYSNTDKAGKKVDTGKYTTVFKRAGSEWKIIRDTWNSDIPPKA